MTVLNSLNQLVEEKQQELIAQSNVFLYWLAGCLEGTGFEDWWWIFKWILDFKKCYDELKQSAVQFKMLTTGFQLLNKPVESLDEGLNCLENINGSLTELRHLSRHARAFREHMDGRKAYRA